MNKNFWAPEIGQVLQCEMQSENPLDKYAVAVKLNDIVVGHLPLGQNGRFADHFFISSELILKINAMPKSLASRLIEERRKG